LIANACLRANFIWSCCLVPLRASGKGISFFIRMPGLASLCGERQIRRKSEVKLNTKWQAVLSWLWHNSVTIIKGNLLKICGHPNFE
jgi:hypothetical protein